MCGLVGLIGKWQTGFLERDVQAFETMLYIDALRGEDATGVTCVNNLGGAVVLKEALHAAWYLYDKEYNETRKLFIDDGKALLGHNRKATMGGRKDEHAHPFCFNDRFIFFHNGTLTNHRALANTEVDSEALGQHLTACEGDVDKIAELLVKVYGAYACVWYDADKQTVYFLRNKERPLSFILLDDGGLAYASEPWMACGSLVRSGIKVKEVKEAKEGVLYSINLSDKDMVLKEEFVPKKAIPLPTKGTLPGLQRVISTVVGNLSRRESRGYIADLKISPYVTFFPDDVVCQSTAEPSTTEVYDWLVMGSCEEYPGVVFKAVIKDLFPYEATDLLDGRIVTAVYDAHEFRKGVLEVWVKHVYHNTRSTACH